jgi:transposase
MLTVFETIYNLKNNKMAKLDQLIGNTGRRTNRYFSQEFKLKKVIELDRKLTTIAEISKQYEVSRVSIYRWVYKYSLMRKKGVKMVVEARSDTARIKALKDHIAALE